MSKIDCFRKHRCVDLKAPAARRIIFRNMSLIRLLMFVMGMLSGKPFNFLFFLGGEGRGRGGGGGGELEDLVSAKFFPH